MNRVVSSLRECATRTLVPLSCHCSYRCSVPPTPCSKSMVAIVRKCAQNC